MTENDNLETLENKIKEASLENNDKNISENNTNNNKENNIPNNTINTINENSNSTYIPFKKMYEIGLKSNEVLCEKYNSNPYIYSETDFHPFSFLTGHRKWGYNKNGLLTAPAPTLLYKEDWIKEPDLSKDGILDGILIDEAKGLVLVDKFICKKFSGLLKDLLSSLLTIAMGKRVSLKVKLFEPKSILQRLTDYWSFLPKFLTPTYDNKMSAINRLKNVMALAISGLYIPTKQLKPFNALITETFEGEYQKDPYHTKVYCEQICNYPTVSRFYLVNSEIKLYGYADLSTHTERLGTQLSFWIKGVTNIEWKKLNEKVSYIFPTVRVLKITSENGRSSYFYNCLVFIDVKNKLKGVIRLGKDYYHIANVEGYIIEYEYPENYEINYEEEQKFGNTYNEKSGKYKVLSTCYGSWLDKFYFDEDEKIWDIDTDIPDWIRPVDYPIPSDGRYREDVIWLQRSFYLAKDDEERKKYEDLAQSWKLMVEKLQREEREMKARQKKGKKKGWLSGWLY